MFSRTVTTVLSLTLLGASAFAQARRHPVYGQSKNVKPSFTFQQRAKVAPDRLLVRFRNSPKTAVSMAAHAKLGAQVLRNFRTIPGLQLVQLPKAVTLSQALQAYRSDATVLYAEPDYMVQLHESVPNDPYFNTASLPLQRSRAWRHFLRESPVALAPPTPLLSV